MSLAAACALAIRQQERQSAPTKVFQGAGAALSNIPNPRAAGGADREIIPAPTAADVGGACVSVPRSRPADLSSFKQERLSLKKGVWQENN
jgi:hypothetical protein